MRVCVCVFVACGSNVVQHVKHFVCSFDFVNRIYLPFVPDSNNNISHLMHATFRDICERERERERESGVRAWPHM